MSNQHDAHLGDLLNRWAAGREPAEERLTQLHQATLNELASAKFADLAELAPGREARRPMYGAVAALAAGVLLAVLLPYLRRVGNDKTIGPGDRPQDVAHAQPDGSPRPDSDEVPAAAKLDVSQLARKAKLLRVLQETFPDDLLWVSETEGEIHIGLRSDSDLSLAHDRPPAELAVRIVVAARQENQLHWKTLCRADVVTGPEELVEVPLDTKGGGQLAVWTCLLPDGMVAVDSDVSLPGMRGLHASASTVQREGVPCRADSRAADGWEYRVFQTVGRVPGGSAPARRPVRRRS